VIEPLDTTDGEIEATLGMDWERRISTYFFERVLDAYNIAKGERRAELKGNIGDFFRVHGRGAFSEAMGAIRACEALLPDLTHLGATAGAIRAEGRSDAQDEFFAMHKLGEALVA
jgi:hypothetical protein